MKASELIKALQELIELYGDCEVLHQGGEGDYWKIVGVTLLAKGAYDDRDSFGIY